MMKTLFLAAALAQNVGDKAPDFTVKNQVGKDVTLSEFVKQKKNVLLAFYPKDFTPG